MSARAGSAIVSIETLRFEYPGRPVLRGVNLRLNDGELFGLLGPNGAGKSTLIRVLCGRLKAQQGRIQVLGRNPYNSSQARKVIGLVPQQIALYRHLSVLENLIAFARLAGVARSEVKSRAQYTLARCDLESVGDRRVAELSGGWQRRANIACGLVHEPRLLVLDEPTVGIDLPARLEIERLLTRLAADGMTIVLISHDLEQVERLADRVGFLIEGQMDRIGPPSELLIDHFQQANEWRVMLERTPDTATVELLEQLGLQAEAAAGQLRWIGRVQTDDEASARMQQLRDIAVREWRVRQPGLDSLWRDLFGATDGHASSPMHQSVLESQAHRNQHL